jgi:DNA-3-methyladenine glycosylase II
MERVGPIDLPGKPATLYQFCRAVLGQQLSTTVAGRIADRFRDLVGDDDTLTSGSLLSISEESLRGVGLSGAKARTVKNLAEFWAAQDLSAVRLRDMPDEEILRLFTQVKGIGPWTVKMVLIFCLRRPDVLPVEDLGVRMGVQRLDNLDKQPSPTEVLTRGERWRPYRTVATWYCWQLLKLPANQEIHG